MCYLKVYSSIYNHTSSPLIRMWGLVRLAQQTCLSLLGFDPKRGTHGISNNYSPLLYIYSNATEHIHEKKSTDGNKWWENKYEKGRYQSSYITKAEPTGVIINARLMLIQIHSLKKWSLPSINWSSDPVFQFCPNSQHQYICVLYWTMFAFIYSVTTFAFIHCDRVIGKHP